VFCLLVFSPFQVFTLLTPLKRHRRELNKLTLVFSHLLTELRVMFKDFVYTPAFKLTKTEAREFWQKAFQDKLVVVCVFPLPLSPAHPLVV
jgi:hypothetical protein